MAQDIDPAVISTHFEVAMVRSQPAIQNLVHFDTARSEMKTQRRLFAAISRVTLDLNPHTFLNVLQWVLRFELFIHRERMTIPRRYR